MSPGAATRPTLQDVARLAGVSLKTASRVLNDEPHVTPATRDKVTDAADALGFRLNVIARDLRRGARSTTVGLVTGDVANPFYGRIARGAERALRAEGLRLVTASTDEDPRLEREIVGDLLERRVRGLLVVSGQADHGHLRSEVDRGVPVVFVDRPPVGIAADAVLLDNAAGAALAARHLLAAGHTRIGVVGDLSRLATHRERIAGFRAVLAEAGVTGWDRHLRTDSHDSEAATTAVHELVHQATPPTALFTTNNRITVGALRALARTATPPALVGFDDFETADLLGTTVVAHDPEAMGRRAVELLLARLGGSTAPPVTTRLPVWLVPRGSGERPPA